MDNNYLMILNIKTFDDFMKLAIERGWVNKLPKTTTTILPEINVYQFNCFNKNLESKRLKPIQVDNFSTEPIHIKDKVIIIGCCLGLVFNGCIYPFGLNHGHNWIRGDQVKIISENQIYLRIKKSKITSHLDQNYDFIGIVSHWGHFFVDTLDRINSITNKSNIIFSDINFFKTVQSAVDNNYCVKQVGELIKILGIEIDDNPKIIMDQNKFYEFNNLNVLSLSSKKPSIPYSPYKNIQNIIMAKFSSSNNNLLYVGRAEVIKRRIINQDQIAERIYAEGGKVIFPEKNNLSISIKEFHSASKIILTLGSTMFNLVFCQPGAHVICVVPFKYSEDPFNSLAMLRHMCFTLNLRLDIYEAESYGSSKNLLNLDIILKNQDISNILKLFNDTPA